jgi:all-trans-8'-apo-beta-carotenal 15,15'-oxygenase
MNRRSFLSGLALAASSSALAPAKVWAGDTGGLSTADAFAARRANEPWLMGWENAPGELDRSALTIEGRLPSALRGSFFRNGPAQHSRGTVRYDHWFDGDGMIHRWGLGEGRVSYKNRFVKTAKRDAEVAAGRFIYPAGGTEIPGSAGVTSPDGINVANTSILAVGDKIWALWEGGSPTRMDAKTLETEGFVTLADNLRGAPFSAHPRVGSDGRIWNIGSLGSMMAVYRLKPDGSLDGVKLHAIPQVGLIHDFILTHKSVVVILPSTTLISGDEPLFTRVLGVAGQAMRVVVFDRETLLQTRSADLPPGYVFHFGNGWEDDVGTIRFDMCQSPDLDHLQRMRPVMRGDLAALGQGNTVSKMVTIPVTGDVGLEVIAAATEFPRINPNFNTRHNRYVYAATQTAPGAGSIWLDGLVKMDLRSGRNQRFAFGDGWLAEEHVFVPRPGATREDDGWLVGTALNYKRSQTCLNIFRADHLTDGPIARAWLDVAMPLGFHGQFVGG